jgi:hypothetical protein
VTGPRRHNHLTRDIKPPGICPACDDYWVTVPLKRGPAADRLIVDDSDGLLEGDETP